MIRPCRSTWVAVRLAVVAAALALGAPPASAQSVAFKIAGEGVGPDGLPLPTQPERGHWVVGNATHLGKHTGAGSVRTDWAVPVFEGDQLVGFEGEFGSGDGGFVFTGANGDKLATNYGRTDRGASAPGAFRLTIVGVTGGGDLVVEAQFVAEFVVDPAASTGKFRGATGSWVMYAWSGPFVLGSSDPLGYAWEGEGRLTFPRP